MTDDIRKQQESLNKFNNDIVGKLFRGWPHDWGHHSLGTLHAQFGQQFLVLPWVCLIREALIGPPDYMYPVQHSSLLSVSLTGSQASSLFQLVRLLELSAEPVQVLLCPCGGEVVTVDTGQQVPLLVPEQARG